MKRIKVGSGSWSRSWVQLLHWAAGLSRCRKWHQQRGTGQPVHTLPQSPCGPSAVWEENKSFLFRFAAPRMGLCNVQLLFFCVLLFVFLQLLYAVWLLTICHVNTTFQNSGNREVPDFCKTSCKKTKTRNLPMPYMWFPIFSIVYNCWTRMHLHTFNPCSRGDYRSFEGGNTLRSQEQHIVEDPAKRQNHMLRKKKSGSAFFCNITLCDWANHRAHHSCDINSAFLLFASISSQTTVLCRHLIALNKWMHSFNWTAWIIFHCLSSTPNNTLPAMQLSALF